jgi:hypothetical protein
MPFEDDQLRLCHQHLTLLGESAWRPWGESSVCWSEEQLLFIEHVQSAGSTVEACRVIDPLRLLSPTAVIST